MLVSVIIPSRERGDLLQQTLRSLNYQTYAPFEVIVVGDTEAEQAITALGYQDRVVFVPFDAPNISAARNAGLVAAQGEIVAFIDDDAVAESHWLTSLMQGFSSDRVLAVGGFVRGRNGISFQWRGETVSSVCTHLPLDLPDDKISYIPPSPKTAPEVMGTNCAYRAAALREIGGFDTGFAYYLDETDVNYRLAQIGAATAIVPWAEVHHGLAPSGHRAAGNVPTSLAQIARSMMLFLDKHAEPDLHERALERLRDTQRRKLLAQMRAGRLTPFAVLKLLRSFDHAVQAEPTEPVIAPHVTSERSVKKLFRQEPPKDSVTFVAWPWQRKKAMERAANAASADCIVTVFDLSPTTLFHRVRFDTKGFWVHRGGIWGRSDRGGRLMQMTTRRKRTDREMKARAYSRSFGRVETL